MHLLCCVLRVHVCACVCKPGVSNPLQIKGSCQLPVLLPLSRGAASPLCLAAQLADVGASLPAATPALETLPSHLDPLPRAGSGAPVISGL